MEQRGGGIRQAKLGAVTLGGCGIGEEGPHYNLPSFPDLNFPHDATQIFGSDLAGPDPSCPTGKARALLRVRE